MLADTLGMESTTVLEDLSPSVPAAETAPHERWVSDTGVVYYRKATEPSSHLQESDIFKSIDSDMRVFCAVLGQNGCHYTPYHSSRYLDRNELRGEFNRLKKEEGIIRRQGLTVKNCATGETGTFLNKSYRMPWGKLDDYYEQINKEQVTGKLAIFVPTNRGDVCKSLKDNSYDSNSARIEYKKRVKDYEFFLLTIWTRNEDEAKAEWRLLTEYLGLALKINKEEKRDVAIQNV